MWEEASPRRRISYMHEELEKTAIKFGIKDSRPKSSVRDQPPVQAQEEKQQREDAQAFMDAQSKAISNEDQALVAELAYGLYEQRGRKDGHDLDDWFNAARQITTQSPLFI